MNDVIKKINSSGWADSGLFKIYIESDEIKIFIDFETGEVLQIICKDYIGFEYIGQWDESVISEINIEQGGDLTAASLNVIKKNYKDPTIPYMTKNINDDWYQLNIRLIDGLVIKVACKDILVEEHKGQTNQPAI
jgi:hypothetical protein